jgi:CheY-like chemotaxis protein
LRQQSAPRRSPSSTAAEASLILLDLMMPVMDGETTLASLKRDARYCDIPVVLMTASTDRKVEGRLPPPPQALA